MSESVKYTDGEASLAPCFGLTHRRCHEGYLCRVNNKSIEKLIFLAYL